MSQKLKEIADSLRGEKQRMDLLSIIRKAAASGTTPSIDEIRSLAVSERMPGGIVPEFIMPGFIVDFILAYLGDAKVDKVLDCWTRLGELAVPLSERCKPNELLAINMNANINEINGILYPKAKIRWVLGNPHHIVNNIHDKFDIVVGAPPFGLPLTTEIIEKNQTTKVRDHADNILILKASRLLKSDGVGIFLTSPNFTHMRDKQCVANNLHLFGLHLDAALSIPSGTFAPSTSMSGMLLIIRKHRPEKLFVAELSDNKEHQSTVLKNLKLRKNAKTLEFGRLISPDSFRTYAILQAQQEFDCLVRNIGFPQRKLLELCKSINLLSKSKEGVFTDLPNCVYLPSIGTSAAVTSISDLTIKPHNYIQLVFDRELANAQYVANYFNSPLGQKVREIVASGVFIPKITKMSVAAAVVAIPDVSEQERMVEIDSEITDHSTQLELLRRNLWRHPKRLKEIERELQYFRRDDDFETWLETLPFPLASILWVYHADSSAEHKVEHVFLFFEALAEFTATLMLSAYAGDLKFYAEESKAWIDTDPKYRDWIKTSTFGGWRVLGERLAKETRRLLADKEQRERCQAAFGYPPREFLELITNKELFSIVTKVEKLRNEWKGHSGATSQRVVRGRLTDLQVHVSAVRKVMLDRWQDTFVVSPVNGVDYDEGIHTYQAKVLIGTRTPFKEELIQSAIPLNPRKLYLFHRNQKKPIELLPFIKLMESPRTQQNACYFYNRMVGDNVRWLSYHFDVESEVVMPDEDVRKALSLITVR